VGSFTSKWLSSRSKIAFLSVGVTPTVPMPWMLEWPRIGCRPAPGRPTIRRISASWAMACTVAAPWRWCVTPIVQANTARLLSAYWAAMSRISRCDTPDFRAMSSQERASSRAASAGQSVQCRFRNSSSTIGSPAALRGFAACISRSRFMIP
jgi:hypothetical protein